MLYMKLTCYILWAILFVGGMICSNLKEAYNLDNHSSLILSIGALIIIVIGLIIPIG